MTVDNFLTQVFINTELIHMIHLRDYDMTKLNPNEILFVLKTTKF